ncbi:MAG: c-type cytochrome [Acidimicrobiia bacterium]|nr:c-type cytochrome [Acidimicrobiia bacterium]MDH3396689.1 c-type cytochrome [Acidimicrobiia bacterium]
MKSEEREEYLKEYDEKKKKGVPFWPDIIFKDVLVSFLLFLILVALAYFLGSSLEEIADPSDANYTPRPEWYFLFLFQLLKFFPGDLEVVGVIVLPVIAIIFLILLPWTDRSKRRHPSGRPVVTGITVAGLVAAIFLTVQAIEEAPLPASATAEGDRVAALYVENCAGCHGPTVIVAPGTDLFAVISAGTHEGMPSWNSDLSADEIDALVGFLLAPNGNEVFAAACAECHTLDQLIEADAIDLRSALELGTGFAPHADAAIPDWKGLLSAAEQAQLLNFLTAPDGQRLWTQLCAACHGRSVAVSGDEAALRDLIVKGGGHLDMPAFGGTLVDTDIQALAIYVMDQTAYPAGEGLFAQHCSSCHAQRVPTAGSLDEAVAAIARGGAHEDMPVWGEILTDEQIGALVAYVFQAADLPDLAGGEDLFAQNCAACHGELGEGGPNPARAGDIIAPISTAEYLRTRDDQTLRAIVSQGQPNFGMSPFGDSFGGPLNDEQIDTIVAFLRAWEADPPVELPPDVPAVPQSTSSGREVYQQLCAQCHGDRGQGGIGTAFGEQAWQSANSDSAIFDAINLGHEATAMIAWGEILTSQQIEQLVAYIRTLNSSGSATGAPTFVGDVLPIFQASCAACHGSLGGWTGTNYEDALNTGEGGPTILPGDPDNSRLVQTLVGTHPDGIVMPPSGALSDTDVQTIVDWIAAGAPER